MSDAMREALIENRSLLYLNLAACGATLTVASAARASASSLAFADALASLIPTRHRSAKACYERCSHVLLPRSEEHTSELQSP